MVCCHSLVAVIIRVGPRLSARTDWLTAGHVTAGPEAAERMGCAVFRAVHHRNRPSATA